MDSKKNSAALSDDDIISRLIGHHDTYLFGVLYDRYAKKVFQKCLSFVKDQDMAADLTQDVFVKVYLNLNKFQFRSKFSTWIYSVAYNICIDHIRLSKRKNLFSQLDCTVDYVNYTTEEVSDEEILAVGLEELRVLMDQLRPEDKMLLLLKYQDKTSVKEIQELLKINESAVKMRLKRAKQKLIALHKQYQKDRKTDKTNCKKVKFEGLN